MKKAQNMPYQSRTLGAEAWYRFKKNKLALGALAIFILLALMAITGELNGLGWGYYWSILVAGALFVYQQKLIANREREACFKAFMNNNYVGLVLFLGLAMSYWHF